MTTFFRFLILSFTVMMGVNACQSDTDLGEKLNSSTALKDRSSTSFAPAVISEEQIVRLYRSFLDTFPGRNHVRFDQHLVYLPEHKIESIVSREPADLTDISYVRMAMVPVVRRGMLEGVIIYDGETRFVGTELFRETARAAVEYPCIDSPERLYLNGLIDMMITHYEPMWDSDFVNYYKMLENDTATCMSARCTNSYSFRTIEYGNGNNRPPTGVTIRYYNRLVSLEHADYQRCFCGEPA